MAGWGIAGDEGWLGKDGRLEYQPRGREGLTDGKPRAAGTKDAAALGCKEWPRGDCGSAVGGGGGQGGEGPGQRGKRGRGEWLD